MMDRLVQTDGRAIRQRKTADLTAGGFKHSLF
jgi:hypothetical protein